LHGQANNPIWQRANHNGETGNTKLETGDFPELITMRLVCCLCWALLGGPVVAQNSPLEQVQQQIQAIADAAEPSVVALVISHNPAHGTVKAERPWELGDYVPAMRQERFGPLRRAAVPQLNPLDLADHRNISNYTLASAIVLDAEQGLLLTTAHLLDGVRKVFVRFPNGGGGSFADLHAADFRSDLAVLKLRTKSPKLRTIRFTTETTPATRGQWVVSLAYPFGTGFIDGKPSVSWGMVSNVGRKGTLPVGSEDMHPGYLTQYSSLIQTDARLNIGVSGGALLNLRGELVGMTSATAGLAGSETAGGFAVPMDRIYRGIIDVLKQGREVEYGFLGVSPGGMSQEPDRPGLYVNTVTPSSGAMLSPASMGRRFAMNRICICSWAGHSRGTK
jgi:S1-C subfamily serine protease